MDSETSVYGELFYGEKATTDEGPLFDGTFFERLSSKSTPTVTVAVCKKCVSSYTEIKGFKRCTSNFLKHLKRKHGDESISEFRLYCKKRKAEMAHSTTSVTSSCSFKSYAPYTQDAFNKDIIKFVSNTMIPLSSIEDPYLANIFEKLNVQNFGLTLLNRRTLVCSLKQYYNKQVTEIKQLLDGVKFACTTVEICSGRTRSYLAVTAHWIDPATLQRVSRALACRKFCGTYSVRRITENLEKIHNDFGLQSNKIVATIAYNTGNFVKGFSAFGVHAKISQNYQNNESPRGNSADDDEDLSIEREGNVTDFDMEQISLPYHFRCCSHTLNLIATVDLEHVLTTNPKLSSIHNGTLEKCNCLWKMGSRPKNAELIHNILGYNLRGPRATKCSSLYDAIKQICTIRDKNVILHKELGLSNPFRDQEFQYMDEYLACLKPIVDALDIFQGENNAYYGLLLPTIVMLRKRLSAMRKKVLQYCEPIARELLAHMERRFESFLTLSGPDAERAIIAALSYPRFKNKWFKCIDAEDQCRINNLFINILSAEFTKTEDANMDMEMHNSKGEDTFFVFDDPIVDDNTLIGHPVQKAKNAITSFFADECQTLQLLNLYPEIKNIFLKFNTPLPSSASVKKFFSFATAVNSPTANRLSNEYFEQRVVINANLNYEEKS